MIVVEVVGTGREPFRRTLYGERDTIRTWVFSDRGRKLQHARYPGKVRLEDGPGVMVAKVPTGKGGPPWQLVAGLVGLLVRRFSDRIASIQVRMVD